MVGHNKVNHVRPFTRKSYRTVRHHVRGRPTLKLKTRRINYSQRNLPVTIPSGITGDKSKLRTVKVNNQERRTKRVKNSTIKAERKSRQRKDKKRAKEMASMIELINDPEILENIGVYVDGHHTLVSSEGNITEEQYDQLIEELESRLELTDDDYDEKIIRKAIRFVEQSQRTADNANNMNNLGAMMGSLSTK
jgi:galactokinase